MTKLGPYDLNEIYTGDARELSKAIPDESVDLIFTDPVYQNIEDYEWLAQEAARALKPDSACLVWCSKPLAAPCQIAMENHLEYVYTLDYVVPAKPYRLRFYHLFLWTTPCLWMQKGHSIPEAWFPDTIISRKQANGDHKWNKNPEAFFQWMQIFTQPGAIVYDPFTGGGTVPAVCKMLQRNYLAFEIDPDTADLARQRVAQTQPPLPFFEPVQPSFQVT